MSEREFEDYLRELSKRLGRALPSDAVTGELRDHLEEHFAELSATGASRDEAVRRALDEFGDSLSLADHLREARGGVRRRRVMRWSGATAVALACAFSLLWAMWPQDARVPLGARVEAQGEPAAATIEDLSKEEAALESILAQPLDVDFVETSLSDVAEFLSAKCPMSFTLDRAGLEDAGVALDRPITFKAKGLPMAKALDLLSREYGIGWTYRDEALEFTTPDEEQSMRLVRTYDVQDLVVGADEQQRAEASRGLVELLEATLNPHLWESQGGPGKATVSGDTLIVTNTWRTHRDLRRMLTEVRRAASVAPKAPAAAFASSPPPSEMERKIEAALRSPTTLDVVETSLVDVAAFLAESHGVAVRIDRQSFENSGLSVDMSVTLRVRNATLLSALNRLVRQQQLAWTVAHDSLLITTPDEREAFLTLKIYPVGDLLGEGDAETRATAIESLTKSISANVMSASWEQEGGPGVARSLAAQRVLWILQTDDGHRQVEKLLSDLRAARQKQGAIAASQNPPRLSIRVYVVSNASDEDIDMEQLASMVKSLVEPDSFRNDALAYAQHVGNRLVVRQTDACHRKISRFLQQELKLHVVPAQAGAMPTGGGGGFF